jgi:HEAT repeat protein
MISVRENTIRELGRLGDSRAVPVLMELLSHKSRDVRLQAINSLGRLPWGETAKVRLEQLVSGDPDRSVGQAAAAVLAAHAQRVPVSPP